MKEPLYPAVGMFLLKILRMESDVKWVHKFVLEFMHKMSEFT
jgi:hypothetical protein